MPQASGAAKVSQTVKDIGGGNATFTELEDRELCTAFFCDHSSNKYLNGFGRMA
jgi:hypothetical protein